MTNDRPSPSPYKWSETVPPTVASPAETAEQRARAVNMIANGHTYEAVAELMARACPAPALHQVEGAPIQALADLLRTATEFCDETANDSWCASVQMHDATQPDCACGYVALRAAVRTLNGSTTGRFSNG